MLQEKINYKGVYGIIVRNNHLMTIRKRRGPYTGMLDLPGGGILAKENLVEALKRELEEEVNILHFKADYIGDFENKCIYDNIDFNHSASLFLVKPNKGYRPYCKDQQEATSLVWTPLDTSSYHEKLTFITQAGLDYLRKP